MSFVRVFFIFSYPCLQYFLLYLHLFCFCRPPRIRSFSWANEFCVMNNVDCVCKTKSNVMSFASACRLMIALLQRVSDSVKLWLATKSQMNTLMLRLSTWLATNMKDGVFATWIRLLALANFCATKTREHINVNEHSG
jgi:hypothetical protein